MSPTAPLSADRAARLAALPLAGLVRPYPNKPGHVLLGDDDARTPRALHPAFYGCFDWHSAVHGHWMLVRLLRCVPAWEEGRAAAVALLDTHLTEANLAVETAYFDEPARRAFERTYGWAWLLRLAQELRTWDDAHARRWARALAPLEARLVELLRDYLPRLSRPIRAGQHGNTAFALAFVLDHARAVGDVALDDLCCERARTWFEGDRDYPWHYEPSGHDFFSPGLMAADLMRRVLDPERFAVWLERYRPGLAEGRLGPWAEPVPVPDVTDGHLVHLAGLALTRAWTLRGIVASLPGGHGGLRALAAAADAHAEAGDAYVHTGDYAGEHWLASFAVYLHTDAWRPGPRASTPAG